MSKKFDFEGWCKLVTVPLINLYIEYAIAKTLAPEIKTVSNGYRCLVSSNCGSIDVNKVEQCITDIRTSIINKSGQEQYDAEFAKVSAKVEYSLDSLLGYISGKDVLMPLLLMRFRKIVNSRFTNISFKHRVSNLCDVGNLGDLHPSIHHAA